MLSLFASCRRNQSIAQEDGILSSTAAVNVTTDQGKRDTE